MKHLITFLFLFITIFSYSQSPNWNKYTLKDHWKKNGADEIEGIYVRSRKLVNTNGFGNSRTNNFVSDEIFYIVKQNDSYIISSFENDIYGTMKKTIGSNKYFLSTNIKYWITNLNENKIFSMYLSYSNELILEDIVYEEDYSKAVISDKFSLVYKPERPVVIEQKSSGSGFAIASNGIIVTNFHVIDGGKSIKVRGLNSDFNKTYSAKILVSDKTNDLAIIQIDDYNFTSLGSIPFTIKTELAGVGENIFVLGYPLRASMGDEIKLTNGIISSKSGFQGEINSYQISAPVQPGNSGGPLFDSQSNLIGIINAKHIGAENVSYAVKVNYLTNLIDLLSQKPKLQVVNSLKLKTLSQQVESVRNFVYIIETE